jgi:alpha-mannosidase
MLDTLLVTGRETARNFKLGVVLDLEHPFQAATDFIAPAFVVPTDAGPPRTGPTGWLFQVDSKAVAISRVEYVPSAAEGRGWGLAFHMLETAGQPVRCRLRTFRPPSWARQTDFQNDVIVDLPIDGDAVHVDFTPHELARVEVTLG